MNVTNDIAWAALDILTYYIYYPTHVYESDPLITDISFRMIEALQDDMQKIGIEITGHSWFDWEWNFPFDIDIYDITPTVLHLLGIPMEEDFDGRSIYPIIKQHKDLQFHFNPLFVPHDNALPIIPDDYAEKKYAVGSGLT